MIKIQSLAKGIEICMTCLHTIEEGADVTVAIDNDPKIFWHVKCPKAPIVAGSIRSYRVDLDLAIVDADARAKFIDKLKREPQKAAEELTAMPGFESLRVEPGEDVEIKLGSRNEHIVIVQMHKTYGLAPKQP